MKPRWFALAFALVLPCASRADTPATADLVGNRAVLRNSRCELVLDRSTGSLVSLGPGANGLRGPWIEAVVEERTGLADWQTWKRGPERTFSGGPATVTVRNTASAASLLVSWRPGPGLTLDALVRLRADDPGPMVQITVGNRTGQCLVDTLRAPVLRGVQLGDGTDDWFTFPHTLGARFRVQGLKPGQTLEQPYPGFLTMQWLDLFDATRGIYLGCCDAYGWSKTLQIGREKDGRSRMAIAFPGCWVARAGDRWTAPWVQFAVHRGDWRSGAAIYRRFAARAFGPPWAPENLREMPSAQCWLAHHASDGDVGRLFEIQQQAPIHASYVMKTLNTSTPEGWDGMRGSALEYTRAFQRIRELGGSPALFTFDRAPLMGRPNYAEHAGRWLLTRRDGSFEEGFRDMLASPFDPEFVQARVGEALRWVRNFGIDEIHYDTEATTGDGMMAGPAYGGSQRPNSVPHGFKQLYRATVAACRKVNPRFTLRAEHLADFWYPEFAAGTAHFLSTSTGALVRALNPPTDAQLMPDLLRTTLPRHAATQMPSMGDGDFWMYGYGMGYGFHGGGPSWTFNPGVRNLEAPPGSLEDRYRFYESDWRRFYDFRVGFEEAVVDAQVSEVRATALLGGKWTPCAYPGPVVAVTHIGGGREVTLGQWYPQADSSAFGRELVGAGATPARPILLRVPTALKSPDVHLYDARGEARAEWRRVAGAVEIRVPDPTRFAVEVSSGPHASITLPSLASPGSKAAVTVTIDRAVPGSLRLALPAGWGSDQVVPVAGGGRFSHAFGVTVPPGIFGRNYPIKAVYSWASTHRTVASHLKVMEPLTLLVGFDGGVGGAEGCVDPGRAARLTVQCVNNTSRAVALDLHVAGNGLDARRRLRLPAMDPRQLGTYTPQPAVAEFGYTCGGVPDRPYRVDLYEGGRLVASRSIYPRTRLMDLNGPWQLGLRPLSRATVGGAERLDDLDTEMVTPDVWDGGWRTVQAPAELDEQARKSSSWGIYRRLVYIPAKWQGADIRFRARRTGAPWGHGGTLNLLYVNGWPAGRFGFADGDCSVARQLVYGGWNLLALASAVPNSLVDPCLFVRDARLPKALQPSAPQSPPPGAFMLLSRRPTGRGITMPFIAGVPADGFRRTDRAVGGENQFLYFAVADAYLFEPMRPVEVEVEYLDTGTGSLGLDYDSLDPTAPIKGAFKSAVGWPISGTGRWLAHTFILKDARFANRQHQGADFRIYGTESDICVRRISVRPAP